MSFQLRQGELFQMRSLDGANTPLETPQECIMEVFVQPLLVLTVAELNSTCHILSCCKLPIILTVYPHKRLMFGRKCIVLKSFLLFT